MNNNEREKYWRVVLFWSKSNEIVFVIFEIKKSLLHPIGNWNFNVNLLGILFKVNCFQFRLTALLIHHYLKGKRNRRQFHSHFRMGNMLTKFLKCLFSHMQKNIESDTQNLKVWAHACFWISNDFEFWSMQLYLQYCPPVFGFIVGYPPERRLQPSKPGVYKLI